MEQQKIIERIRKLLAMSEDSSSPHEAAIAATRASKLMQQHNLERAEILLETIDQDSLTEEKSKHAHAQVPRWVNHLIVPVARLHDCEARFSWVWDGGTQKKAAEFLGEAEDVLVAKYVFDYLIDEIKRLSNAYRKATGAGRSDMFDFRLGACYGIKAVISQMMREKRETERSSATGTALVVVKNELIKQKYSVSYSNRSFDNRQSAAAARGYEAGKGVSIRRGLTESRQARI